MDGFTGGIIAPGPCVDVDNVVRSDNKMPRMADAIGEDRSAEAGRQFQAAVVAGACATGGANRGLVSMRGPRADESTKGGKHTEDNGNRNEESDRRERPHEILLSNVRIISTERSGMPLVFWQRSERKFVFCP